jgi:hypothetical protein
MSIVPDDIVADPSSNPMPQENNDDPHREDIEDPSLQVIPDNRVGDENTGNPPHATTGNSAGLEPCQGCGGLMSRDYLCSLCDKSIHWWCAVNGKEGMGHGKHYICPKCKEEETVSQNGDEGTLEIPSEEKMKEEQEFLHYKMRKNAQVLLMET